MAKKDCEICIFPLLGGCPVCCSYHNAACLTLFKDRNTCKKEDCEKCRWLKYCKEKGINLNKET
jgi:hypothetical protein